MFLGPTEMHSAPLMHYFSLLAAPIDRQTRSQKGESGSCYPPSQRPLIRNRFTDPTGACLRNTSDRFRPPPPLPPVGLYFPSKAEMRSYTNTYSLSPFISYYCATTVFVMFFRYEKKIPKPKKREKTAIIRFFSLFLFVFSFWLFIVDFRNEKKSGCVLPCSIK